MKEGPARADGGAVSWKLPPKAPAQAVPRTRWGGGTKHSVASVPADVAAKGGPRGGWPGASSRPAVPFVIEM